MKRVVVPAHVEGWRGDRDGRHLNRHRTVLRHRARLRNWKRPPHYGVSPTYDKRLAFKLTVLEGILTDTKKNLRAAHDSKSDSAEINTISSSIKENRPFSLTP